MCRIDTLGKVGDKNEFERVFVDLVDNGLGHGVEPHPLSVAQVERPHQWGAGVGSGHLLLSRNDEHRFNPPSSRGKSSHAPRANRRAGRACH